MYLRVNKLVIGYHNFVICTTILRLFTFLTVYTNFNYLQRAFWPQRHEQLDWVGEQFSGVGSWSLKCYNFFERRI